ncbi:MAG TPA: hypothetical protein VN887_03215 [Candidatus Angelobacter sp.]|nr:hypothetical protein [Candidatus Angelobacter sp.]
MFGFLQSKKAEVLQHWIAFVEGFQLSSSEFYDSVEQELKAREVPGMEMARVEFAEGGILSDKRYYLRMVRERLVFDVCAAPFGRSFFFSCRFAEIPAVIKLWQLAVLLISFTAIVIFTWREAGFILGTLLLMAALTLLIYTLRNAVAMGLRDLDAALIKAPVFGPVYERFFRKETYYRHDTRLMYLEVVSGVVKRLAEDAVAAKGLKLIKQYEQAPILGELYKPVKPTPEPEK